MRLFIKIKAFLENHEILAQKFQNIGPIGPIKNEAGRLNLGTYNHRLTVPTTFGTVIEIFEL